MKRNIDDKLHHLEGYLKGVKSRVERLEKAVFNQSHSDSTSLIYPYIDPIYEIDLREFHTGDTIEFEETRFGILKVIIKHK